MRLIALLSLIIVCGPFIVVGSSIGLSDESESSSSTSASRESRQKGYRQLEAEKTDKMKDDQEKGEKEDVQEITEKGDDEKLVEKDKEENKKEDKDENKKEDKEKDEKDLKISGSPEGDVILINPTEDPRIDPTEDRDEIEPGDKLVRAAAKNDMKEVKRLLDSGVNVDTPGRLPITPIFMPDTRGPRIMHRPRHRIMRKPMNKAAFRDFRFPPGLSSRRLTTALIEASRNKHLKMMKFLISKEADPNKCLQGKCPLCASVSGRNVANTAIKAMKTLKDAGADLDTKCRRRETPLIFVAARNSVKLVKELLKMGADPQVENNDYHHSTLLATVLRSGTYHKGNPEEVLEVAKAIIKKDPEAVNSTNKHNETPLLNVLDVGAGTENILEIVKFLIQNGADVNAEDKYGFTPLMYAASQYNPAVVKLLLDNNADVNAQNKDKKTPLMKLLRASTNRFENTTNSLDIAKMLLEKGADPNAQAVQYFYDGSGGNEATPRSIIDQAKTILKDRKEKERKAEEESEKMQKMVQLLKQYADKKGF